MSARWPLPRWRSARLDPHKGADLEGRFCAGGFRDAVRPSGHLPFATRSLSRSAVFGTRACFFSSPPTAQGRKLVHGAGAPRRCGPSSQPRRRRHWDGRGREARAARPRPRWHAWPARAWRIVHPGSASCEDTGCRASCSPGASACPRWWPGAARDQPCGEVTSLVEGRRVANGRHQRGGVQRADPRNAG